MTDAIDDIRILRARLRMVAAYANQLSWSPKTRKIANDLHKLLEADVYLLEQPLPAEPVKGQTS